MLGTEAAISRGVGGYQVGNSLLLNSQNSSYLTRDPPTAGSSGERTFTISMWVKRAKLGTTQCLIQAGFSTTSYGGITIQSSDVYDWFDYPGSYQSQLQTAGKQRDPADWQHLVFRFDSTQADATLRNRIYIDGVEVDYGTVNRPSLNDNHFLTGTYLHQIGRKIGASDYNDMYYSEVVMLDNVSADPTAFGEWNKKAPNVWQPKDLSNLDFSGVNSCYLNFADPNDIGKDVSGNGNSWTPVNLASTDVVTDTPTNNASTFSPLKTSGTLSEGNRHWLNTGSNGVSSIEVSSGKWYVEIEMLVAPGTASYVGVMDSTGGYNSINASNFGWGYRSNGNKYYGTLAENYGANWNVLGAILGIALDLDAGTVEYFVDNVSQGIAHSNLIAGSYCFAAKGSTGSHKFYMRCNEDELTYTPPTGFNALMAKYLPEPTILDAKQYFDPVAYTGDGIDGRTIETRNLCNHVIIKNRDVAWNWRVWDDERNLPSDWPSQTLMWDTNSQQGLEFSMRSGGNTGMVIGPGGAINDPNNKYIMYPFTKSPIAGLDIVIYTGDKVAGRQVTHNIGVAPDRMFVKQLTSNN